MCHKRAGVDLLGLGGVTEFLGSPKNRHAVDSRDMHTWRSAVGDSRKRVKLANGAYQGAHYGGQGATYARNRVIKSTNAELAGAGGWGRASTSQVQVQAPAPRETRLVSLIWPALVAVVSNWHARRQEDKLTPLTGRHAIAALPTSPGAHRRHRLVVLVIVWYRKRIKGKDSDCEGVEHDDEEHQDTHAARRLVQLPEAERAPYDAHLAESWVSGVGTSAAGARVARGEPPPNVPSTKLRYKSAGNEGE